MSSREGDERGRGGGQGGGSGSTRTRDDDSGEQGTTRERRGGEAGRRGANDPAPGPPGGGSSSTFSLRELMRRTSSSGPPPPRRRREEDEEQEAHRSAPPPSHERTHRPEGSMFAGRFEPPPPRPRGDEGQPPSQPPPSSYRIPRRSDPQQGTTASSTTSAPRQHDGRTRIDLGRPPSAAPSSYLHSHPHPTGGSRPSHHHHHQQQQGRDNDRDRERDRMGGGGGAWRGGGGGGDQGGGPGARFGGGQGPSRGGPFVGPPPRRSGPLSDVNSVTTNSLVAAVSSHFGFYQITVTIRDSAGKEIDSRFVRRMLFRKAVLDQHLRHLSPPERRDVYRTYFFVGSYFYAIRNYPKFRTGEVLYHGPEGSLQIGAIRHYTAPTPMVTAPPPPSAPATGRGRLGEVAVDVHRCARCTRTFATLPSLLAHCAQTGHEPITSSIEGGSSEGKVEHDDPNIVKSTPASVEVMVAYANCVLQATLNADPHLKKWGREHVDLTSKSEPTDRNRRPLGLELYRAYSASFSASRILMSPGSNDPNDSVVRLVLTVDLKAKIMRTRTLLQILCGDRNDPDRFHFSREHQEWAKREWEGKIIIHKHEKRCYTIHQLLFDHSARTLPIRDKSMSHEDYYRNVKGMELRYPTATPMVAVVGRREEIIYFPAEIVTSNDLDPAVREKLPQIASYPPKTRHDEIERFKRYVTPGSARSRSSREDGTNLLPAAGIVLAEDRLVVPARVLSAPTLMAAGVRLASANPENWGNALSRATYNVNPQEQTVMDAVIFYHRSVTREGALRAFHTIRNRVNGFQTKFRLADEPYRMVETVPVQNDKSHHCEELERFLSAKSESRNLFFLQFVKPVHGNVDPDYSPVKYMLLRFGWLTQFVNFAKCDHGNSREQKSPIILQGVARQVLQKCGARLWWTTIPRSLPLPALFIGIDVSHGPKVFDSEHRGFLRKMSCAAIVTVVVRGGGPSSDTVEMFCTTSAKYPGAESCLELDLQENVERTIHACNVEPACVIGWRDGLSDTAFEELAAEEVRGIRAGLSGTHDVGSKRKCRDDVPVAYIICQKDVANKFLCVQQQQGQVSSAPSGTLVSSLCGWDKDHEGRLETFYLNGRSPPFSTAKPVRFVVYERDEQLLEVPLPELTWNQCHEYPNWTGPVKLPAVTMMAHKLSKLAGTFADCGANIDQDRLVNHPYFL